MSSAPINLAVLVSGSGTTLQNLLDEIAAAQLNATISTVIASRPNIAAIDRARRSNLISIVVDRTKFNDPSKFSHEVFARCLDSGVQLVCLAGWLTLLQIPQNFTHRVINIHPALLPSFGGKGMYGANVHQAVLDHGCKISGCTVHFVDAHYDHGPIILQRSCPVDPNDTPPILAARVFEEEKIAYPAAIRLFHENRLQIHGRIVRVLPPQC